MFSAIDPWRARRMKYLLYIYNPCAMGPGIRLFWGCSAARLLKEYERHATANHLDIGVGTGYFLERCRFPSPSPRLAIMDLNAGALEIAAKRLGRYSPEVYQRDVMAPLCLDIPRFDSVGVFNLIHCLPGTMETKGAVFRQVRALLNPEGVLFGSTVLGKGIRSNALSRLVLKLANAARVMSNREDDPSGLHRNLSLYYSESHVELVGHEAVFWARR
jgi:SAM-dependent methyltransferase